MSASLPSILILAFLVLQRIAELALSRRNTLKLLSKGAKEYGAEHYPVMVTMHLSWLIAIGYFGAGRSIHVAWFVLFLVLQVFRIWIIASLGERWTTRIIVLDEPLVDQGPFSILKHPNYVLVIVEIFTVPMMFGLPTVAAVFSALNAMILVIRVGCEEAALAQLRCAATSPN